MKFNHDSDYFYKQVESSFDVEWDFTLDLSTGDTLASCTVTITDSNGDDQTVAMISNKTVATPDVTFTVSAGSANETYQIKIVGTSANSKIYTHYIVCEVFGDLTLNSKLGAPNADSYVVLKEANSYIRNKYGHTNKWDTLDVNGKKRVLIQACKDLNRFNFINPPYYDNQALAFPDDDHKTISGDCATPVTINSFKSTKFTSDTYGGRKSNVDYWKYGAVHMTTATPINDVRVIDTSNITTDVITTLSDFSATPTVNTNFKAFEPLDLDIKHAQIEQVLYILGNAGEETLYNYRTAGADEVSIGDVRVRFGKGASAIKTPISPVARKMLSKYIRKYKRVGRA